MDNKILASPVANDMAAYKAAKKRREREREIDRAIEKIDRLEKTVEELLMTIQNRKDK
jgi:hypothetical protein